jgi:transposase
LLLRCAACHGARLQRGGLDLRSLTALRAGSDNGPVLVPGDPDASLLIERIETEACPPRGQLLKYFVRRPPKSEVQILRDWIGAGAPEAEVTPDVATSQPDTMISAEDRQHWAFQPPQPTASAAGSAAVDSFIAAKLQEAGLDFAPEANRDTLIRRAYFDLLGIPPSVAEWQRWRRSEDPAWYAAMIDQLLASPRYGERWGRYWLDLVGYADSEGGVSADPIRPVAWKYRDYVINAFNEDKPYDRFLIEQLAGDELIDFREASTVTEEMVENLTATGMLRMGIDQTGSRTMNFVPERLGVIGDAIRVVGSSVMGLTLECARCHSHRYDPIPHRDYYRFKAIFQGAFDEHDWLSFKNRYLEVATAEQRARVAEVNPPLQRALRALQKEQQAAVVELRLETLRQHYPDQTEADRQATLVALGKADNQRTLPQRTLVEKLARAELLPDHDQPAPVLEARRVVARLEDRVAAVERQMEPPLKVRALWDRGEPSPTYILHRGEHNKPGRLVGPGVPSVLTDGQTAFAVGAPFPDGTSTTGRRLAFARWLTQPDHPLTARVIVNRIWYHHFGTGLVKTLENFGRQGERPSHPELLDWLARQFVEQGWSIKTMHRRLMNSRTYRQSSRIDAERRERDPGGRLLLRNNATVRHLAAGLAKQVEAAVAEEQAGEQAGVAAKVDAVYHRALSRPPRDEERELGVAALRQLATDWSGDRRVALETYCHAILNSAAFVYLD